MILAQKRHQINGTEQRTQKLAHIITHLFDKEVKNIKWRKDNVFSKWCLESWAAMCKSMKLFRTPLTYVRINSKR